MESAIGYTSKHGVCSISSNRAICVKPNTHKIQSPAGPKTVPLEKVRQANRTHLRGRTKLVVLAACLNGLICILLWVGPHLEFTVWQTRSSHFRATLSYHLHLRLDSGIDPQIGPKFIAYGSDPRYRRFNAGGIWLTISPQPSGGAIHELSIAAYWPLFCELLLIATLFLRSVRHNKRTTGHDSRICACGYDLRFTPSRCPECGTPVDSRS